MSKSASSVVEWKRVTMVSTAKLYYDVSVRIVFSKRSKSKLTDILPNLKCFLQCSSHCRRRDLLRWVRNVNTVRQVLQLNCEILIMINVSLCPCDNALAGRKGEYCPHATKCVMRYKLVFYYTFGSIVIICMFAKNYGKSETSSFAGHYMATFTIPE